MARNEEYIYAGIPTFMGSDFVDTNSPQNDISSYDVCFLGVPCDYGASYRLGAKYAPRTLREYSFWDRIDGYIAYDIDANKERQVNNLKIVDIGDVNVNPTDPKANQEAITKFVRFARDNCFPVVCGGDHSITYGSFLGVKQSLLSHNSSPYELGIIHIDAHLDVEEGYLQMPEVWHGNVFRKLIEDGHLDGKNLFTIGVRGLTEKKFYDFETEHKVHVISSNAVKRNGVQFVLDEIKRRNATGQMKYYVSFDIDSIDMSYVSGTGTPYFNGLSPENVKDLLIGLREFDICGIDIVELNPQIDSSNSSFVIACELLRQFLSFGSINWFKERGYESSSSI